jgi:monofunctional biosynthetic peptidoglycan transglycosylase
MKPAGASVLRLLGLVLVSVLSLQLFFVARVAWMAFADPQSTTFQRSELWRMTSEKGRLSWSRRWVDYAHIAPTLKRAVIASEDAGFAEHSGIEWDAVEKAWERNQKAAETVERQNEAAERRGAAKGSRPAAASPKGPPKVVGGSTITQQLAKNLFLGSERSLGRKGQEVLIAWSLEALLGKERILEIYLNSVEWGEGVFGAEAAARHYFRTDAAHLAASQAARLAVMLPAPKRFEKRPASPYLLARTATVMARMGAVELP